MPGVSDGYRWVDEDHDLDWSVAVIKGRTADEVVATYGGDATRPFEPMTFAQAKTWRNVHFEEAGLLVLRQVDHVVVAVEPNGWASSIAEVARRQSAGGGHFFSVHWSPSAHRVLEAVNGEVTALFDPIYVEPGSDEPQNGEVYPAWLTGSEFLDDQRIRSTCVTLIEEHTGVSIERAWLDEQQPTFVIPDPDTLLEGATGIRLP